MIQNKSRLEAISDGIFAFAATLVVVSLEVSDTFAELRQNLSQVYSFFVSFMGLILIWRTHYNFFRRSTWVDNWIFAYNFCMLFVVLCYVFPLKFLAKLIFRETRLANPGELAELFQLYCAGFALIFLFLALMYRRAGRVEKNPELLFWSRHFGIFVLVGGLGFLAASLGWGLKFGLPGMLFMSLGPLCYAHGVYSKDFRKKGEGD